MAPPLLTLSDIALTFGSTPLLTNAELTLYEGDRLCLVGRNGSGKSTLLKIAAKIIEPDEGKIFLKPGTTLRYLPQEPDLTAYKNIDTYVRTGLQGADTDYRIPYLLDALSLDATMPTEQLSGGEARRAALARTLAPEPDILMLDEPTNHLDLPVIEWLEGELSAMNAALILISHDRYFLSRLSQRTLWMDRGETRALDKGFADFEDWRDEMLEREELERHKLKRKIHREQHWIVHGVSGRRKRNVRRVKELAQLRKNVKNQRQIKGQVSFSVAQGARSGKSVLELSGVSKSYGDRLIVKDLSIKLARGERLGLVGPNGAGKTTLLKLMMGELSPDQGEITLGANLLPLIIDQKRESLNPDWTLGEALTDGRGETVIIGDKSIHVQRYMKDFLFLPEQVRTPLHALSGGECGRLQLARALRRPSNLLVLDEPTNDLDLETLDLLQELIADYKGTVILVSHDRDFLDRTVTRTLASEGAGHWQVYAGGYDDMKRQRASAKRAAKAASQSAKQTTKQTLTSENASLPEQNKKPPVKLSYKHKFRLEQLPAEITALEAEIAKLQTALADPNLFTTDPDIFNNKAGRLAAAQSDLDSLETEWLRLEALKE